MQEREEGERKGSKTEAKTKKRKRREGGEEKKR